MKHIRVPLFRFARTQSGSVAVEFALLLPVYIAFMFGIIEFGRMIWIRNSMEFAAETAARYGAITSRAIANGAASGTLTTSDIETEAQNQLIGVDPSTVSFSATIGTSTVTVVGTHNFTTLISAYVPIPATTLTVTATLGW
jgi:Flp pilus assembly protein TadG